MKRFIVLLMTLMCMGLINSMEELPAPRPGAKMALWEAANTGDVETVKWYIANRADINSPSPGGESPLALAANNQNEEIVALLLAAGANPNTRNLNGHTPLHFALFQGQLAIADALIEAGADVNAKDYRKLTPLMAAAKRGYANMVRKLIAAGASIDDVNRNGYTAQRYALQLNRNDVVQILNQARDLQSQYEDQEDEECSEDESEGDYASSDDLPSILDAAEDGDIEMVLWHLQNGADVDSRNDADETPLMLAAAYGHTEIVQDLLANGAQVDAIGIYGNSALMLALMRTHIDCAKILLKAGANPNIVNNVGETAWWIASRNYLQDFLPLLLVAGANPHASLAAIAHAQEEERRLEKMNPGHTKFEIADEKRVPIESIWEAATLGDQAVVEWYLKNESGQQAAQNVAIQETPEQLKAWIADAELMLQNKQGNQEDLLASLEEYRERMKILLSGDEPMLDQLIINAENERGETPLMLAAANGWVEIVQLLLDHGAQLDSVDKDGNTALIKALMERDRERFWGGEPRIRVKYGSDDEMESESEEEFPPEGTQVAIARLLLASGADWKIKNHLHQDALYIAVQQNKGLIVTQLIGAGADPNSQTQGDYDYTMLMVAAYLHGLESIEALVKGGADINGTDDDGVTALMIAATRYDSKTIKLLLALGVAVDAQDITGRTALDYARRQGNERGIALLEEAEKQLPVPLQPSVLMKAAKKGNVNLVKETLKKNVDINAQDKKGATALVVAVRWGTLAMVKLLLDNGARVDTRNDTGLTPLHSAAIRGDMGIIKLLLERGADINEQDYSKGRTSLHWVVRMSEGGVEKLAPRIPMAKAVQLIKFLLGKGVDPARVDLEGKTAFKWAKKFKLQPLVGELEKVTPVRPRAQAEKNVVKAAQPKAAPKKAGKGNVAQKIAPPAKQKAKAPKNVAPAQPKAAKAQPGKQAKNPKAAPVQPKAKAAKQAATPVKQKAQAVKGAVKAKAPQAPEGPDAQAEAARRKAQSERAKAMNKAKTKKPQPQNINNNNNLGWLLDLSPEVAFRVALLSFPGI